MSHTPGPWIARPTNSGDWHISEDYGAPLAHAIIPAFAPTEDAANAKLIAAAPALLDAARNALAVARWPLTVTEEEYHEILDALEAVIAKAEGEG